MQGRLTCSGLGKFAIIEHMEHVRMGKIKNQREKAEIFESMPVSRALATMALPTIVSQLINLVYNIADTWFIGQSNDPYMVAAASLALGMVYVSVSVANLFSVGGGTLVVRLMGAKRDGEAKKVASLTLVMSMASALVFSLFCLSFMDPLLRMLGASDLTIGYARQYMLCVVVIGCPFSILNIVMSAMVRNIGYSKEASIGLGMGGLLNIALDPLFMFVLLPEGYQVLGAAVATLLSHICTFLYFSFIFYRLRHKSVLSLPRRIERVERSSLVSLFSVGLPAAASGFMYDVAHVCVSRLTSTHGDMALAAFGIVMKVERVPMSIGVGVCLAMVPLAAYNYASGDHERMRAFFRAARRAGLAVALVGLLVYRFFAPQIMGAFIEEAETVRLGTQFLRARCFAIPFMFLCFHMVHFMQAINRGKYSFVMSFVRQVCLNIPILFLMNWLLGIDGIVWTQFLADGINVGILYIIYHRVMKNLEKERMIQANASQEN